MEITEQKQPQKEAGTVKFISHVGDETLDGSPTAVAPRTALDSG